MKNYSVLIKCGTTSPEQLASVLMRMKFYPDDYRYTLAKLLQGCDAIIDQSAEPTQDAESPAENPCHPPNTPKLKRLVLQMTDYAEPVLTNVELNGNGQVYCPAGPNRQGRIRSAVCFSGSWRRFGYRLPFLSNASRPAFRYQTEKHFSNSMEYPRGY
jgi:hypothetical protein